MQPPSRFEMLKKKKGQTGVWSLMLSDVLDSKSIYLGWTYVVVWWWKVEQKHQMQE
eukprot:m.66007 g.66007  ORF g.66007 m.66007 type:complete len:56 (+) comp23633_c0_seq1:164-331(+)